MDPPLVNESSFSAANPSAYSLASIWPFVGEHGGSALGLRMASLGQNLGGFIESSTNRDGSLEESTVTEQSGGGRKRKDVSSEDESSRMVSTSSANQLVSDFCTQVPFDLNLVMLTHKNDVGQICAL